MATTTTSFVKLPSSEVKLSLRGTLSKSFFLPSLLDHGLDRALPGGHVADVLTFYPVMVIQRGPRLRKARLLTTLSSRDIPVISWPWTTRLQVRYPLEIEILLHLSDYCHDFRPFHLETTAWVSPYPLLFLLQRRWMYADCENKIVIKFYHTPSRNSRLRDTVSSAWLNALGSQHTRPSARLERQTSVFFLPLVFLLWIWVVLTKHFVFLLSFYRAHGIVKTECAMRNTSRLNDWEVTGLGPLILKFLYIMVYSYFDPQLFLLFAMAFSDLYFYRIVMLYIRAIF